MKVLTAAFFGGLFGLGLIVSGMTDPARVLGFLDVAGDWNPALAFVMGGAVLTALPAFAIARRRRVSLLGDAVEPPDRRIINARLLIGAAVFGVGWGLVGICPGPGLVLLGQNPLRAGVFVAAIAVGALVARLRGTASGAAEPSPAPQPQS